MDNEKKVGIDYEGECKRLTEENNQLRSEVNTLKEQCKNIEAESTKRLVDARELAVNQARVRDYDIERMKLYKRFYEDAHGGSR